MISPDLSDKFDEWQKGAHSKQGWVRFYIAIVIVFLAIEILFWRWFFLSAIITAVAVLTGTLAYIYAGNASEKIRSEFNKMLLRDRAENEYGGKIDQYFVMNSRSHPHLIPFVSLQRSSRLILSLITISIFIFMIPLLVPKLIPRSYDRDCSHSIQNGNYDDAIEQCSEAIKLDPNLASSYYNRGLAYRREGNIDRAIADYSRVIDLNPKDAEAYMDRGHAYFIAGKFANAGADFLQAVDLKQDPYSMIFRFLARERHGEKAASELEANALRLKSKEWPYAVFELYLNKQQPNSALAAAANSDEQCQAYFYVGEWYISQNRQADAQSMLRKAAEVCPKSVIERAVAQAELNRLQS